MIKTIKLVYAPWYCSNGCDCCEPTEMPGYNLYIDGKIVEGFEVPTNFYGPDDAYEYVLEKLGIEIEVDYEEDDEPTKMEE